MFTYAHVHKITNESVHVFDLAGGLAIGFELLSSLTANHGPREADAPAQPRGTGLNLVRGEGLFGMSRVLIRGEGISLGGFPEILLCRSCGVNP